MVATTRGKPFGHEGHPFIVEAGVSLGGKLSKEGITVHRFANRIPLLFEAGGDVVTKTAQALRCACSGHSTNSLTAPSHSGSSLHCPAGPTTKSTRRRRRSACLSAS